LLLKSNTLYIIIKKRFPPGDLFFFSYPSAEADGNAAEADGNATEADGNAAEADGN
jgi:hypothetical protein